MEGRTLTSAKKIRLSLVALCALVIIVVFCGTGENPYVTEVQPEPVVLAEPVQFDDAQTYLVMK